MTDNETIKLFCTEWLLQNDCSRGNNCIFIHANMRDVTLCDDPDEEEVFVKGSYNSGWQRKVKSKRGRQRGKNSRQNLNRENNSRRYGTRNSHKMNKHNELNVPSTSSHQMTSNTPGSSSTGAFKKIFNNKKSSERILAPNTSESEDENSKNLPNLQHSKKDWINSCEFISKNAKNSVLNEKNKCDETEAASKHTVLEEEKKGLEVAGAVALSEEKVCGICFEVIMQKSSSFERRFGILPNCNHCFCLTCIRKWRQAKQFENNIIRACPECRVSSDFVCPSTYWVETESAKEKLINNYKQVLSKKDCKYFKKGSGSCPFGNKCFYLHALNNGTKVDVGPPPSQRYENEVSDEMDLIEKLVLLEYFHNDLFSYSLIDDDDDDDDDEDDDDVDIFDMLWDSDDDLCFY